MADSQDRPHPLVEALPPATDYITYLTLLEYNLKAEDLPLLNDLLQDATLTVNIGWDLVFLLIPLLPASEPCLGTIARMGNPREVLLKVTEALRCIEFEPAEEQGDQNEDSKAVVAETKDDSRDDQPSAATGATDSYSSELDAKKALPYLQFEVLISMLSILHRRIKTKFPSRFVATTLQGVLAAFSNVDSRHEQLLAAIATFVRQVLKSRRPDLPPRESEGQTPISANSSSEVDPEAQPEPASEEEHEMTKRLLQGFVTHVVEAYMSSLSTDPDVAGLAWSSRIFEIMQPQKLVPGRQSLEKRFTEKGDLASREASMKLMTTLALELGLSFADLLKGALESEHSESQTAHPEEDPPESAEDIPLSKTGALSLLTARSLEQALKKSDDASVPELELFPTQLKIAQAFIGTEEEGGLNTAGFEPATVLDAVLALGLVALSQNSIGEPESDEQFAQYLQIVTLVSANSSSPSLRFYAHFLATSVLRAHPSDVYRLTFIRDTLEHCPIENLKASAVSWIKGEVVEANLMGGVSLDEKPATVFTTPVCLETLGPFLFPDLTQALGSTDVLENWTMLKMNLSFYLAVLNFYYLLLSARQLHAPLNVAGLHVDNDIGGCMIGPLRQKSKEFRESLDGGPLASVEGDQGKAVATSDLDILDDVLERVERGVVELNKS